jgi:ferric-dicitrate binding protein FerR (iron transport regulator)
LQDHPENRSYYQALKVAYWRQQWAMRESLIRQKSERRYRLVAKRRRLMCRFLAAAASVCLLLGGAMCYWWSQTSTISTPSVVMESIAVGTSKAKLYLSSGEEVLLTKESKSISEQQAVIEVDSNGVLAYQNGEIASEEKLIYNRLVVERGGEYKLQLSDGSEVWINSNTELEYPVHFGTGRRLVKMNGEAYFKVKSDDLHPFVVEVNGVEITALGTEFCVNSYSDRYVKSVLVQGKIEVESGDKQVVLRPNQLAVYDRSTRQAKVQQVDVRKYIDWKTGDFVFSNDRLEEVMEKVALWYDCQIVFVHENMKEMRISGDMKRYARIESFLHYLKLTTGGRFETKGKVIYIYAK